MTWLLVGAVFVWWFWRALVDIDDREVLLLVDGLGDEDPALVRAADRARRREAARAARRAWLRRMRGAVRNQMRKWGLLPWAVLAAGFLWSGCGIKLPPLPLPSPSPSVSPTPAPTPEPTPTPLPHPGPDCQPGVVNCGCWDQRPGEGRMWPCCEDGGVTRVNDRAKCPPPPTPPPTPGPTPPPTPKPPKPSPLPSPCVTGCPPSAWQCADKIEWELKQGNWTALPNSTLIYNDPGNNPALRQCLDRKCNRVDCASGRILAPASDGWFGICIPQPCPEPSPTPTPGPTPSTPPGTCPPLLEVGGSMLQPRSCAPGCQRDGYLGYVVNWTATELISADTGLCAPGRNRCEMPRACQDTRGAYTWLYLPGVFPLSICDERSDNPFNCHHKPKANETGITYFISCPWGVTPPEPPARDGRCTIHRVDVRPDRPVELK